MDKFIYWIGYTIERIKCAFNAGVSGYYTEKFNDLGETEIYEMVASNPAGNYVAAIKLHRQHFGSGLKEAKDAVDGIREKIGYKRED